MKPCLRYDEDAIGIRYATAEARALLRRDEAELGAAEREARRRFEEFEAHYLACPECLSKVRRHQEIGAAWRRLGGLGARGAAPHARRRPSANWPAMAASLLLVSTVSLSVWVASLSRRLDDATRSPQTVARVFALEPETPVHRSGAGSEVQIPSGTPSFVLSVEIPEEGQDGRRFALRLLDASTQELWRDDDAAVDPEEGLLVHVREGFLAPGEHTLEVTVLSRDSGDVLANGIYPFVLKE